MIELESSPHRSVVQAAPDEFFQSQASYPQIARCGGTGQRFLKAFSCLYSGKRNENLIFLRLCALWRTGWMGLRTRENESWERRLGKRERGLRKRGLGPVVIPFPSDQRLRTQTVLCMYFSIPTSPKILSIELPEANYKPSIVPGLSDHFNLREHRPHFH
jgi:hypothetical protein